MHRLAARPVFYIEDGPVKFITKMQQLGLLPVFWNEDMNLKVQYKHDIRTRIFRGSTCAHSGGEHKSECMRF